MADNETKIPGSIGYLLDEFMKARKLLWFRHGCDISALYGDDGEMQCSQCLVDFKRWSFDDIEQYFKRRSMTKFLNEQAAKSSPK